MKKSSRNPSQPSKCPHKSRSTSDLSRKTFVVEKSEILRFSAEECASRVMLRPRPSPIIVSTPLMGFLDMASQTLYAVLSRGGLICNIVVALTVFNSASQRGTDIRDSDVSQQFCSTQSNTCC